MKRPFEDLRELAINVADTVGATLDEPCSVSAEGWQFERYAFTIHAGGVDFEFSIPRDDIDKHFEGE